MPTILILAALAGGGYLLYEHVLKPKPAPPPPPPIRPGAAAAVATKAGTVLDRAASLVRQFFPTLGNLDVSSMAKVYAQYLTAKESGENPDGMVVDSGQMSDSTLALLNRLLDKEDFRAVKVPTLTPALVQYRLERITVRPEFFMLP